MALSREVAQSLFGILENAQRAGSLHISQPCQLSINCAHLTSACDFFESYVSSFGDPRYLKVFRLQARDHLQTTRTQVRRVCMCLGVGGIRRANRVQPRLSLAASLGV